MCELTSTALPIAATHVAGEHEFAAAAAAVTLDPGDGRLRHGSEAIGHRVKRSELFRARRRRRRQLLDQVDVGMSDEKFGVRALQHDDLHGGIGLERAAGAIEVGDQRLVEQVDRTVVDRHEGHAAVDRDAQRLVVMTCHVSPVDRAGPTG